jgi:N-acetylmuramoyl-L-alanine amidase
MMIVSIDPGHGGQDTGAVRGGVQEKDVVLNVARLVRTLSQQWSLGLEVRLTRDFDKNLSLEEAGQLSKGAHVVIALHADAAAGPNPQGMWATYMPDSVRA